MPPSLNIFISHCWDHDGLYQDLIELLNATIDVGWYDHSVSRDNAIFIATDDEEAIQQRQQLLLSGFDTIDKQASDIDRVIAQVREKIARASNERDELKAYQQIDELFAGLRERILEPTYTESIRRLERIQKKYLGADVNAAQRDIGRCIQEAELTIIRLQAEGDSLVREAHSYKASLANLGTIRLGETGKQRDRVIENFPNLALAIHNRIAASDLVLVIVTPNSAYRQWTEFEYQEAFVLRKPTIGVLRRDVTESLPADLRSYGITPVMWDPVLIKQAIQTVARGRGPT